MKSEPHWPNIGAGPWLDFSRYLRYYGKDGNRLQNDQDWGVYQFPDGQNQIWFSGDSEIEWLYVCLNHPAITDLVWQAAAAIGPLNIFVTYLYGARSDKTHSGDRRVPNVAHAIRELLGRASEGKELKILVPHDSQENAATYSPSLNLSAYDGIVYPDSSSRSRQPWLHSSGLPEITFEKVRDQQTGQITGLQLCDELPGNHLLVADDICDGGATFLKVAELLPDCVLDLSVTHGVFSGRALENLTDAGYREIFTTNSFVQPDVMRLLAISSRCTISEVWEPGYGG